MALLVPVLVGHTTNQSQETKLYGKVCGCLKKTLLLQNIVRATLETRTVAATATATTKNPHIHTPMQIRTKKCLFPPRLPVGVKKKTGVALEEGEGDKKHGIGSWGQGGSEEGEKGGVGRGERGRRKKKTSSSAQFPSNFWSFPLLLLPHLSPSPRFFLVVFRRPSCGFPASPSGKLPQVDRKRNRSRRNCPSPGGGEESTTKTP